jgi:hypothetical protein
VQYPIVLRFSYRSLVELRPVSGRRHVVGQPFFRTAGPYAFQTYSSRQITGNPESICIVPDIRIVFEPRGRTGGVCIVGERTSAEDALPTL